MLPLAPVSVLYSMYQGSHVQGDGQKKVDALTQSHLHYLKHKAEHSPVGSTEDQIQPPQLRLPPHSVLVRCAPATFLELANLILTSRELYLQFLCLGCYSLNLCMAIQISDQRSPSQRRFPHNTSEGSSRVTLYYILLFSSYFLSLSDIVYLITFYLSLPSTIKGL